MLSSIYFLSNKKKIENVKSNGSLIQNDNLGMLVFEREKDEVSKFAFIVSKKASGLSVHRNRIKRAIAETVRQNMTNINKGYDVVFLAKSTLEKMSTDEIMKVTRALLIKSTLLQ